jgi:predicted SprT family Zn-dependent metalloprotease
MRFLKQLEFLFREPDSRTHRLRRQTSNAELKVIARELLRKLGADKLALEVRVEWNPRMRSAAGRAHYREKLISLNPLLKHHGEEVNRTLRHELAHLLAQFRIGRRRIAPHGPEWRQACRDLGIADEERCHNLPFLRKRIRGATFIVARIAKKNSFASAAFVARSRAWPVAEHTTEENSMFVFN